MPVPKTNLDWLTLTVEEPLDPVGNGNGSDMTAFANEVHDGPTILATLKVVESEVGQLPSSKTTAE